MSAILHSDIEGCWGNGAELLLGARIVHPVNWLHSKKKRSEKTEHTTLHTGIANSHCEHFLVNDKNLD